jgi:cyclophilin family peptidyl-prolyl cis-trans isomerase
MKRVAMTMAIAVLGVGAADVEVRRADRTPVRQTPAMPTALARTLDPVISAAWSAFDVGAARGHVRFVSQYWRLAGNEGYDAALDRVFARLTTPGVGFEAAGPQIGPANTASKTTSSTEKPTPGVGYFEQYPNTGHGWDHSVGTLALVHAGKPDEVLLSRTNDHVALCINSFSTVQGGVTARLVDVGRGDQEANYAGKDVKGAVVLGDADVGTLWRRAVMAHGAIGVVSTSLGDYINPNPPGAKATPRDTWNILQWGSIPYDEATKGFGFKATPHAAATMRKAIAGARDAGGSDVTVHVTVASTFSNKPARTLVAEIPGRVAPAERVVIAVHVQEPGASDNASGVATLTEMARAMAIGIKQGRIPPPDRTLTFLWVEEITGSREWLKAHPEEARNVRYMFSMDMTGEDVKKTGGSFLIERWPDPGAVFERPWDPHSEWGRGNVRENQLKGDLLNDLHLAVCRRVARKSAWVVNSNPYEGGSDHTVFGSAGIPSVLNWHFTDRYYHSSLDTADKTSATEMRNVAVSVAASAWLLASANETTTLAVADLVSKAGQVRIATEEIEGAKLAAAEPDRNVASRKQDQIVQAWKKWYGEAVRSASRLVVGPQSAGFSQKLDALAAVFSGGTARDLKPGEVAVVVTTPFGDIGIAVDTLHAPVTSSNFLKYVDGGFYTNGRFHRVTRPDNYTPVLPNRPPMAIIQGGINPAKSREGFPPIPLERTSVTGLKHVVGTVSMARGTADSATSDFFICLDDQPSLDFGGKRFDDEQGAAAFGRVLSGLDVVRKIQQQPAQGQSLTPPVSILGMSRSK